MSDLHGKGVLVIDEDPYLRYRLGHALSQAGAQVCAAASGKEGLRLFDVQRPHVVILAATLPGMDGWEVCRQLRCLSDVPIILLLASSQDEDAMRGLELGEVAGLSKPFSPQALIAQVKAALSQARLASNVGPYWRPAWCGNGA